MLYILVADRVENHEMDDILVGTLFGAENQALSIVQ